MMASSAGNGGVRFYLVFMPKSQPIHQHLAGNGAGAEGLNQAEASALDNAEIERQAQAWYREHNSYPDFFNLVRLLRDKAFANENLANLPMVVEFIGQIAYGENEEALSEIRGDPLLANKLWGCVFDCATRLLRDALDKKKRLGTQPQVQTWKMLDRNSEIIRNSLAAIINFVAADFASIPTESYCSIVPILKEIWYEGALDEFLTLPYSPLENLTNSKARSTYLLESGNLSLAILVDRTRKYPFDSAQYAALVRVIGNLSQLSVVSKELLTTGLENETEVLLEHLIPAMQLKNPATLRVTISGMFKNLAMHPDSHAILLDKNRDFLSCALGPIFGSGEYSEEEQMNLPIALYGTLLSGNVERDPLKIVRFNTVEFIYQLCSIRSSREALRDQNVYCLMREYHKWEQDQSLLDLIEQVVNILIQTEDEIGVEDFKALSVE